jgi:hypothetical protein
MGDRCYAEVTVLRCDLAKWEELGYSLEDGEDEAGSQYVKLVDCERNYGISNDDEDRVTGCPMFGSHGEGGDYAAHLVACDGETYMEHPMSRNGNPIVECGPDGPGEDDVELAKEFLAFYNRVAVMVKGEPAIR